jgi:Subtilase family
MKTKLIQFIASLALAFIACGGSAAAAPGDKLPKPEDPVVLPTEAETAELIKNRRDSELRMLKSDKDGWDDLWVMLQKSYDKDYKFDPKDNAKDTDEDGVTDYEEMLVGRNATHKEPVYTKEQLIEQVREGRRQAIKAEIDLEANFQKALEAAKPNLRELIPNGQWATERATKEAEDGSAALRILAAREKSSEPQRKFELEAIARKYGVPTTIERPNGGKQILIGEEAGGPIYIGSHNVVGAASISADEVWPVDAVAWPHSDANTGLGLTGAGQTLSLWEPDGGVRTSHSDFGVRVTQKDSSAVAASGHPSNVAGTMAGGGATTLFGLRASRGVAYGSNVFAYDLTGFLTERATAAAGSATAPVAPPIRVSNHSWGVVCGWTQEDINPSPTVTNTQWVWKGLPSTAFTEDYKFGFYTPTPTSNAAGISCVEVDTFATQAPKHLMVYSCGNDRNEGPGSAVTYYRLVSGSYVSDTATRDWQDGDDGLFDSCAPPGTSKNVLTVGAVEDVFRNVNGVRIYGFHPNANIVPATFTGAGPTDDGRIKPDLVAVGTPNLPLRQFLGQVANNTILGLITAGSASDTDFNNFTEGTSFSAPAVSGIFGLVMQRRAQLYPNLPASEAWCNSTQKAILIGTCDDVGAPGPDYVMGNGLANARGAVGVVGDDFTLGRGALIKEFSLAPSATVSWVVTSDGTRPFDFTTVWTDVPGAALTTVNTTENQIAMLVNNINLQVQNLQTGEILNPWVLNPDLTNKTVVARSAAATRGVDNRNNVEKVSMAAPAAGRYRVTVTHAGGIAGNAAPSNQLVSVVTTGVIPELPTITSIIRSATPGQFLLSFTGDVGAFFTIQTTTNLSTWTNSGSVLTAAGTNSVVLNTGSSDLKRFWRLKRGQ